MRRALADTSVFVAEEADRGLGELPEELAVSVVTLAELEVGVLLARGSHLRSRRLTTLRRVRELDALTIDADVASVFAALVADLRERGARLRVNDTWIAATAVAARLPVCTQGTDFSAIPQVEVISV